MATTQEVETSVTVNNRPILDYDQTDDHAQPTYKDSSDDNNDNEIDDEENTDSIQHDDNMAWMCMRLTIVRLAKPSTVTFQWHGEARVLCLLLPQILQRVSRNLAFDNGLKK